MLTARCCLGTLTEIEELFGFKKNQKRESESKTMISRSGTSFQLVDKRDAVSVEKWIVVDVNKLLEEMFVLFNVGNFVGVK